MKKRTHWLWLVLIAIAIICTCILVRRYQQRRDAAAVAYTGAMDAIDQIAEMELSAGDQTSKAFIAAVRDHRIQLQKQLQDGTLKSNDIERMLLDKMLSSHSRLVIESPADRRAREEELNKKLGSTGNN